MDEISDGSAEAIRAKILTLPEVSRLRGRIDLDLQFNLKLNSPRRATRLCTYSFSGT